MREKKTGVRGSKRKRKGGVKSKLGEKRNSNPSSLLSLDKGELKELIRIVEKSGVEELEISKGGTSVRIRKPSPFSAAERGRVIVETHPVSSSRGGDETESGKAGEEAVETKSELVPIKSPMVGTFYCAPGPDADPYVEIGSFVEAGQVVCIVEAMKLMNEIESDVNGRIVQIPVENAQPVEYGQALFLVDVKGKR